MKMENGLLEKAVFYWGQYKCFLAEDRAFGEFFRKLKINRWGFVYFFEILAQIDKNKH